MSGFHLLFATSSIKAARAYYQEFKRQQADSTGGTQAQRRTIPTRPTPTLQALAALRRNHGPLSLPRDDRAFLDDAIADYNQLLGPTSAPTPGFEGYYESLSKVLTDKRVSIL